MHDVLIIGGGTAGAVLAARLSEDPQRSVLLVEAGQDTPPGSVPADIRDPFPAATINPAYFWQGLTAAAGEGGEPRPYPQARVMGGGSSINGLIALRGLPSDYARWAAAGATDFTWDKVLSRFRAIEGGMHPVCRTPREQWPSFLRAMEQAAARAGLAGVPDINEESGDGFYAMPNAIDTHGRVTTAGCYLTEEVRARPNLQIMAGTQVARLRLSKGRVTGIDAIRGGETIHLSAGAVAVCAGAIHSPTLLLRSGIGPAAELGALGIQPVADLQGVGRNLQNHPYMFFALTLPRGKRAAQEQRRFALAGIRSSSGMPGCPQGDLFNFMIGRVSGESYGPDFALVGSALYAPQSRGSVRLRSAEPLDNPDINFRFMADPADPPRMVMAARLAERLLREADVTADYHEAFLLPGALAMKQFNRQGLTGKILAMAAEAAANSPGFLRRNIFSRAFKSGPPVARRGAGREISDEQILSSISPMGHPAGTCAMGRAGDPMSVVDESFRVHGMANLFVADASVMPVIPSANTNLPTIMLAEVAAGHLAGTLPNTRNQGI